MPVQCTCVGCGRRFLVPPSLAHRKWCSAACRYATPGWVDALGTRNRKACVCAICGAPFTAAQSKVGRYCSRKCLGIANGQRVSRTREPLKRHTFTCAECGRPYERWLTLTSRTRFCSHTCRALWHNQRRRILRPTGIERALGAALVACGIAIQREYRVGRFSIDFAVPERRLAVEADGDYWHAQPKQIARDARKNAYLHSLGWRVIRFTETQIMADAAACAALVARLL